MTFQQALNDIKQRPLTDFVTLTQSKGSGMYCCPICGSGTGQHKTGALMLYKNTNRVTCFSDGCFGSKGEDTPGALAKIWECNLREVLIRAGYQIDDGKKTPPRPKTKREPQPPPEIVDYTNDYKAWHNLLLQDNGALDYLHQRGINDEAIGHFNLGYAPEWIHPSNKRYRSPKKEARLIIPRGVDAYSARTMDPNETDKYKVIKKHLFNEKSFIDAKDKMPVLVVEGEIDAILIWQLNYHVVALGTVHNKELFVERAKEYPSVVYILALDNDDIGRATQAEIGELLTQANISCISANTEALYNGMKDAGDAVPQDAESFCIRLIPYLEQGYNMRLERDKAAEIEAYNRSGPGMVDSFLQDVQTKRYQPISSGIPAIDRAIGGGFIRESVVMLGAAPGMGKTALISQVCENIAAAGEADILYINLEMSREVLLARSIARIANAGGKIITVNEILRGYEWDTGTREIIAMAAEEYKQTIAGHLIYNPGKPETDLDKIMGKVEDERRRLGHAPVTCLDYLQLLTGRQGEDSIDVIKRAMQTFKQYANDNHTIVFIITANNRDSMKTGESGLNSGRDSSNIEYGADVHLGIEYERVGTRVKGVITGADGEPDAKIEKGKDLSFIGAVKKAYNKMLYRNAGIPTDRWSGEDRTLQTLYNEYCTRFVVRVNKNRYSDSEKTATLIFDGAAARFVEPEKLDTWHTEPPTTETEPVQESDLPF